MPHELAYWLHGANHLDGLPALVRFVGGDDGGAGAERWRREPAVQPNQGCTGEEGRMVEMVTRG